MKYFRWAFWTTVFTVDFLILLFLLLLLLNKYSVFNMLWDAMGSVLP